MPFDWTLWQGAQAVVPLSALAAVCIVLTLAWPLIARDRMAERIRRVEDNRSRSHRRAKPGKSVTASGPSLLFARQPNRIFVRIVDRLSLARLTDESSAARLLRMAGLRGRAPMMTYLAWRLIAAAMMPGIALVYILLVLKMDLALPVLAAIAAAGGALGYMLPRLYVGNLIAKRQGSLRRSWPDALDLLLICVESGMSSEAAFRKVAEEIGTQSRELAEEMSLTTAELAYLSDRRQAFENLGKRTGLDSIKATVIGLIQSEKYGTSLGQTLRVLAKESRDFRMLAAEKKAAALPPKLTVPMILFFLPVLFAVIATPAVLQALGAT